MTERFDGTHKTETFGSMFGFQRSAVGLGHRNSHLLICPKIRCETLNSADVARLVTSLIRRPWYIDRFMGLVTGLENTEFDKSSSPL